jgi:Ala-tRNA(Pro) deacylase
MSINRKLKDFLEEKNIEWKEIQHPLAYTASATASAQHVSGETLLKPVIVKDNKEDEFWMCVISAAQRLDFTQLKQVLGDDRDLQLASEQEVNQCFPDFEPGAEPPIGSFGKMRVLLDSSCGNSDQVVFNGGTHTDTVMMSRKEYERIAEPEFCTIARHL